MIQLKKFQEKAKNILVNKTLSLLDKKDKKIILRSCTGSGKTVITAFYIKELFEKLKLENKDVCAIWISIGKGELHKQSKKSIEEKIGLSVDTKLIEEVVLNSNNSLPQNTIIFANWESLRNKDSKTGDWANLYMRDGDNNNFVDLVKETKNEGRKIILVIDESHSNAKSDRAKELIEIIKPNLIYEMSATPDLNEELNKKDIEDYRKEEYKGTELNENFLYTVNPNDVIDEGLITKKIKINNIDEKEIDKKDIVTSILSNSYKKHLEIKKAYEEENIKINPLLLIQIPNGKDGDLYKEEVLNYFEEKEINLENKKLAIWLSEENTNIKEITKNTSNVEVLIFKQAIDTGWDCPRAKILVICRDIKSEVFKVQTVGRTLRMPEQKHYDNELLNEAYIYSLTQDFKVEQENYEPTILCDLKTNIKDSARGFTINPSYFKKNRIVEKIDNPFSEKVRKNLNDIKNKNNILTREDFIDFLYKKGFFMEFNNVDKYILLNEEINYEEFLKTNKENININKENENSFLYNLDNKRIQIEYSKLIKSLSPIESISYMDQVYRKLFREYVLSNASAFQSKCFILNNRDKIIKFIQNVLLSYRYEVNEKNTKNQKEYKDLDFVLKNSENFNSKEYEKIKECANYAYNECYLNKNRPQTEKGFEEELMKEETIKWWYKNKDNGRESFGIPYEENNIKRTFYPDYIVKYKNGSIGIYEVKSYSEIEKGEGSTTSLKLKALRQWLNDKTSQDKSIQYKGDIVFVKENDSFFNKKGEIFRL